MRTTWSPTDNKAVIRIVGPLDFRTASQLAELLERQFVQPTAVQRLVLDLAEVERLDTAGVEMLELAWRKAERRGIGLDIVTGESRPARSALMENGVLRLLPFGGQRRDLSSTSVTAKTVSKPVGADCRGRRPPPPRPRYQ